MKLIIVVLSLVFIHQNNIYAFDEIFFYGLVNFNTNHTTSLNNNHFSSNYKLGFSQDNKRRFTHVPDGSSISMEKYALSRLGISINNFSDITEYRFVAELIDFSIFSYIDIPWIEVKKSNDYEDSKNYDNDVIYGGIKVLRINNDIFRKIDNEWIQLHFGRGLYLLNSDLNMIIPSVYIAAGYSSFKPEMRNSEKLKEFRDTDFSGLDLELGANIKIEFKNLDVNGTFSYKRIFEINPDIEILQNNLKIGYTHYSTLKDNGIDGFLTDNYKAFSIYLIGNYDLLKVNSLIQENPSIGIQIEINPYHLLNAIYIASNSKK